MKAAASIINCAGARAGRAIPDRRNFSSAFRTTFWSATESPTGRRTESIDAVQRVVEGQYFEARQTLWKYAGLIEDHRNIAQGRRRELLMEGADVRVLAAIDLAWSDYLAAVTELREGIHWRSWGGREPFHEFITDAEQMFGELMERIESISTAEEIPAPAVDRRHLDVPGERQSVRHDG